MALDIRSVPLFAGVEDKERLLIYTLDELQKETVDNVTVNQPLYFLYKKKGWLDIRDTIGLYAPVNIEKDANTTVKAYMTFDDADYTPQDPFAQAQFAYGHIAGTQVYSREELVKTENSVEDLVEKLGDNLSHTMTNVYGGMIMGSQTADGRSFEGLGNIMTYNAVSGGLDPTNPKYAFWNPQRMLKTGGSQYSLATELRAGLRQLARLCSYNNLYPDIFMMGSDVFDAQMAFMEGAVRITLDQLQNDKGGWENFEMYEHRGSVYLYDKSLAAKQVWAINHKFLSIRIHKGTNFIFDQWAPIPGKISAKARNCLLISNVICRRRDAQGTGTFT